MTKIAFITGITGQDGSYLAEFLLEKNYKVYGIQRRTSLFNTSRIDHIRNKITMRYGDMTDSSALSNYIHDIINSNEGFEVFEIYNLAAQSHVGISFEIPEYTAMVDGIGVLKILEIINSLPKNIIDKIRFYQASTSELYGKVLETPQSETTPFNPVSPYASAKQYAFYIVKNYREAYNIFCCSGILFNHEGPRRGENFLTQKVVRGVDMIMKNKLKVLQLGNLDSKRDWGDARDYIRGMWMILQNDKPEDFVLATGTTHTVRSFVEKSFRYYNIDIVWEGEGVDEVGKDKSSGRIMVKVNPKYFRPNEVDLLLGDPTKAKNVLGWEPTITLDQMISDMFKALN
jgi:GDPmannose 4,6-dehydratase